MKNNFNNIWKYVAGGATVLGYQAWYDRITSKNNMTEIKNQITDVSTKLDGLSNKIDKCADPVEKAKLLNDQQQAKDYLTNLWDIQNKFHKDCTGLAEKSDKSISLYDEYNAQFKAAFDKASKHAEDLEKTINNLSSKLMDDHSLSQIINNFKDYLATLSVTDICLVMNIFVSIFIFTCLVSIILAVYGNFLIDKLSLETKYPKLNSIISLRAKLQHTYVITNTLFILVALILMFFVNLITLISG